MLLASATLLTGCSIGGKEIVLDINTTNSHTVFSVDNMKCDKTEALIYLANYKNLYGTMYDVNLLETDDASNVEKYIRDVTVDELTRIYCMVSIAKQKKITLTDKEKSSVSKAAKEYHDSLNEAERNSQRLIYQTLRAHTSIMRLRKSCTILYRRALIQR